MLRLFSLGIVLLLVSGCATYGVVVNVPDTTPDIYNSISNLSFRYGQGSGDITLILTFSGGGTRAAALAYGVMEELRDTRVVIEGRPTRLLEEVDIISSVSGGSFTAAYYGLYGEQIFDDFEDAFLRRDVESGLINRLLNPLRWFSLTGRSDMAVDYYDDILFNGATFADMKKRGGPLVVINASDLGNGVRFSFIPEYFYLLCSDISSFPVARAVTASSAVPVVFSPVVVENYPDCKVTKPHWLAAVEKRSADNPQLSQIIASLWNYFEKDDKSRYVHFVDGGITDNLGLHSIYEVVELSGGTQELMKQLGRKSARNIAIISVNAVTDTEPEMNRTKKKPTLKQTINAVTDVQIHRYNATTLKLMKQTLARWARELSTPDRPATPHFIQVSFQDINQPEKLQFFNRIPTSFSLTDEQVDRLILAGHDLLRNNPDYQRFLAALGGARAEGL